MIYTPPIISEIGLTGISAIPAVEKAAMPPGLPILDLNQL
jgi:hypothetical protein